MRKKAKNDFEKDFYKLANNSVFGKFMECVRNRKDLKLIYDSKKAQKILNSRLFKDYKEINDDLVLIESYKKSCVLDKPIIIGQSILDLSKVHMYDFFYNHLKKNYNENVSLIYTDTDSLIFQVFCDDFYEDMLKNKHLYDLSEFNKDSKFYDATNNKIIGMFKDECSKAPISEFLAIRAKCYSYKCEDNSNIKKIKGITKSVVKNEITHNDFKECLLNNTTKNVDMNMIRSYKHQIYTQTVNKLALCSLNDKRYMIDPINSLAHGHFKIKEMNL